MRGWCAANRMGGSRLSRAEPGSWISWYPRPGSACSASNGLDKELEEIIKMGSAVVVQSSRVGEGRIVRWNNWYESGMVVVDNLSPQKAALLLTLALTKTSSVDEIQRLFDEY